MSDQTQENDDIDLSTASNDDLATMGLPPRFTLEGLQSFLSDEEIDRLAEGDDPLITREEIEAGRAAAAADNDQDHGDDDDDADDDEDDGDEDGDAGEEAATEPAPKPVDQTPDPAWKPLDTSAQDAAITAASDEMKQLRAAYDDGDLTDAEFYEKTDAINDKLIEAKIEKREAEKGNAADLKAYQDAWYDRVGTVMETTVFGDSTAQADLGGYSYLHVYDEACRRVTGSPQCAHMSLTEKADYAAKVATQWIKETWGKDVPAKAGAAPTPKEPTPAEKARAQGRRPKPVQTLANVTAATETGVDNSRFAHIDREVGLGAERAYSQMSAAEKEAYLRGA